MLRMPLASKRLAVVGLLFLLVFSFPGVSVYARGLDDIQQEIDEQNKNLKDINSKLAQAENELKGIQASLNNTQGEIPRLQAEISQIATEIEINRLQISQSTEEQKLKALEQEEREVRQLRALKASYQDWRAKRNSSPLKNIETEVKQQVYQAEVAGRELGGIEQLEADVEVLTRELAELEEKTKSLETQSAQLNQRKEAALARIAALQNNVRAQSGAVAGLRGQIAVIQSNISQLSQEQKALQDYEAWLLGQSGNGGTNPLTSGQLYLTGRGRDLYQGHGVGMSQFGAFGAGYAGWNAAQILKFYYTGTDVVSYAGNINVAGYGVMNLNDYAAGQAEVPYKACGNADQVAARPDKYTIDNPSTVWDCWPEEAIKAQVIAFRTYALHWAQNYGSAICTTASCQVYNGSRNSAWAAEETRDQVVTYAGKVIEALYSSDNNNGWGTANNETVFSSITGNGTPVPYLRGVNDNAFAYKSSWNSWSWRTNGYDRNVGANSFKSLINFAAQDYYLTASSRSFMSELAAAIGDVNAINLERDVSGRVAKVTFVGTNGVSRTMAGWFFKTIWNSWVDQTQPTGQKDFIYSLTFYPLTYTNP